jgi:hypothetical protein
MEELNQVKIKSPVRRTRNQIAKLLKEYESKEGMTTIEFCKLHNINKSNFYNWQKRYGSQQRNNSKAKGFIPIEVSPSCQPCGSVSSLFAEVNGIRLYQVVAAEYLKALVS